MKIAQHITLITPKLLLGFAIMLLWCGIAQAEQSRDDILSAVDLFPRAEVTNEQEREVVDYSVALGKVKKIRGFWSPDREIRVEGELLRRTAQVPSGHSAKEVFNFYRKSLLNINARALYLCEARDCGTSNAWANQVFSIKELYGLDSNQYYGVYEIVDVDQHLNYVIVYAVARGNKRVFAHLELVMTNKSANEALAPDPKTISQQLLEDGFYIVSGLTANNGELAVEPAHLDALVAALRIQRFMKVRIVGHVYSDDPHVAQLSESLGYAKQLRELLHEKGISGDRLDPHGIGSLAPMRKGYDSDATGRRSVRIEIVRGE
ncbi:hypothetical protein NBRC116494_27270 [Aurantivibrio plasticivorans]